jgi:hypothetical protein
MRYPVSLITTSVAHAKNDLFIGDPHSRKGLVARVYENPLAARLMASAPDLKYALEAILRVQVDSQGDFPTIEHALTEIRSIAADALEPLERDNAADNRLI